MQKRREPGVAVVNKMTLEMLPEVNQVHLQLVHFGYQEHEYEDNTFRAVNNCSWISLPSEVQT